MSAWITSPLAQYGALALGLLICLVLFVSLKLEISLVRRMLKEEHEAPPPVAEAAAAEAPVPTVLPPMLPPPQLLGPDLNLTTRAQALRMQHRGESVSTIAGALRAPRNEIELLLKLQSLNSSNQ
jgi:hypothetical protein